MEQRSPGSNDGYLLFVGNTGSRLTESELKATVKRYGTVESVHVVKDDITGLSCGYAFVRMTDGTQAGRAVSELNGKRIDGRLLVVRRLF